MNIYERNLNALKKHSKLINLLQANHKEKVDVLRTRNGSYTCKFQGVLVHSIANPQKEAEDLIKDIEPDVEVIVILGFGFGFHIQKLIERLISDRTELLVIEPSPLLFQTALQWVDITSIIDYPRIDFFFNQEKEQISKIVRKSIAGDKKFKVFVHPVLKNFWPVYYRDILILIRGIVK